MLSLFSQLWLPKPQDAGGGVSFPVVLLLMA